MSGVSEPEGTNTEVIAKLGQTVKSWHSPMWAAAVARSAVADERIVAGDPSLCPQPMT